MKVTYRRLLQILTLNIGLFQNVVATIVLTSNVEKNEIHLACAGQLVVMTCTVSSTNSLEWRSNRFQNPVLYSTFVDSVGDTIDMNMFTANLTQVVPDGTGLSTVTSTLTVTATASLDGTTVTCDAGGESKSLILNVTSAPPSSPQSPQLNVTEFNVGGATVTVEWTYPDDGPAAESYTVSLSVGESVTTTELMAIIEEVPYNQTLTGSVVATNCNGSGSPALLEAVPCGIPSPPTNGLIEVFTTTEVVYRCDPGLGPTEVTATCESGNWTPTPADLMCTQTTTVTSDALPSGTVVPDTSPPSSPTASPMATTAATASPTSTPSAKDTNDDSSSGLSGGEVAAIVIVVLVVPACGIVVVIAVLLGHRKYKGAVNLAASKETVEMKDNMSYGPVRVQSQTATQEPVYEEPDAVQQPAHIHTGGNVAYGHIRPHC